jgi:AcrR family transcriptional regulator
MSPRKPAVLRNGDGRNLREYLIATAARLIGQRGGARLAVRDIAREAHVADGVLYNYFDDKEDLLAHALLAHVGAVMAAAPQMPAAGTGSVADNLRSFIDGGLATLARVAPAFAGLLSQPKVLSRFHAMVGGDEAFGAARAGGDEAPREHDQAPGEHDQDPAGGSAGGRGLPEILTAYLTAEQQLGRIAAGADVEATVVMIVGAIHGQVLPRVLFGPPGSPIAVPQDLAGRIAATILHGIAPDSARS